MAYFNHAFNKVFLGTGETLAPVSPTPSNPASDGGFITTKDVPLATPNNTYGLASLAPGYFFFYDPNTNLSVDPTDVKCCPLVLASSSLLSKDKLNQYTGGYKETNKSKLINPKYVQKYYVVDSCEPEQAIISIGNTSQTNESYYDTLPVNFQSGTTLGECCKEFLCGETYYLRIDVKGSPALRFLNHQAYQTLSAYTGCCTTTTPTAVDSTLVMIAWAEAIIINNYIKQLVLPIVFDEDANPWYAPGTTNDPLSGSPVNSSSWWTNYVSPGHQAGKCAGMRLIGAYVETKFLNCSFQATDFFEKEPVRIFASLVDYNGDPCVFERLCVYNDCRGLQGIGFGEQVARDLILSQSYLQNFFHSDIRIREITQGNEILDAVDRNVFYTRYYILHSVPRFNNPTGVFDNDRYMLEIVTNGRITALEDALNAWIGTCSDCTGLEEISCTPCEEVAPNAVPEP